ncbi:SDR family oxidoreductase [Mesorhizobium sp. M7A.F.Ca.US.006.01.1.1]|uniref:SDR family NAD(P)-dependent oxidoreductase n=1 Tax=Mesorhizobium sp. M7A.F.Ca.US.006.01.1.1 TaxID=2496707 RepID=UPI000FCCB645|nr:SDR family oxidoreductase [Mesorhizobium sp. M7A.F.Ca.US.006.01.1.1]RUZ74209.1 SDR family oxidoreductase [Mesorhizobium sp. M7A.F.Ca.US.006.01.1.1]
MKDLPVLIVGGGAGLGALLAQIAVDAGAAKIGIIDINQDATEAALAPAKANGLPTATAPCDIQVGPQCHAAFDAIVSKLGRIDTLINCAAIYPRRPLLEISDADWDASNGINIKGTYHMMVAVVRHMQSQEPKSHVRGRIVNLTSVDAFKAHPQNAHYAATKAAVVSLTRSFAHDVAKHGILVNSVALAGMATERAKALGFLEELAKASPLGRGAEPTEIAEWVLMTGGPKYTYMTGENVIVSGGYIYA